MTEDDTINALKGFKNVAVLLLYISPTSVEYKYIYDEFVETCNKFNITILSHDDEGDWWAFQSETKQAMYDFFRHEIFETEDVAWFDVAPTDDIQRLVVLYHEAFL